MTVLAALLVAAAAQEPVARWTVAPAEVAIGEPIELVVDLAHPPNAAPDGPELELDYGWEVIAGPTRRTIEGGTRLAWKVLALEPGEHEVPPLHVALADGSRVLVASGAVTVQGQLDPEEDAPRPLPGFRTIEERTSPVRPSHLLVALLGLVVLGLVGFVSWRRARRPRPEDEPTELERFRGLDRGAVAAQPLAVELSRLLRRATERHLGLEATREAFTDEEWIEALRLDGRIAADRVGALEAVLSQCADVKFAGVQPTRFAVDEWFARAEELLVGFAPSPEPAAGEEATG